MGRSPLVLADRHNNPRNAYYPIRLTFSFLAYRGGRLVQEGVGETSQISSSEIKLKPSEPVRPDSTSIKLSIAWPARLEDGTGLQFVVQGKPVWNGSSLTGVEILRHEFRTKRSAAVSERAGEPPIRAAVGA